MLLHVRQNAAEQRNVAVDQVESAFVWLTTQARCDHDHICVFGAFSPAAGDFLRCHQGRTVQQVQGLAFTQFLIDVDEIDLTDNLARLQRKPGTGPNQSTTTNNADFHTLLGFSV